MPGCDSRRDRVDTLSFPWKSTGQCGPNRPESQTLALVSSSGSRNTRPISIGLAKSGFPHLDQRSRKRILNTHLITHRFMILGSRNLPMNSSSITPLGNVPTSDLQETAMAPQIAPKTAVPPERDLQQREIIPPHRLS